MSVTRLDTLLSFMLRDIKLRTTTSGDRHAIVVTVVSFTRMSARMSCSVQHGHGEIILCGARFSSYTVISPTVSGFVRTEPKGSIVRHYVHLISRQSLAIKRHFVSFPRSNA